MNDSERPRQAQAGAPARDEDAVPPVAEIPAAVMGRFTAAEARLYPMALTDPDGYQLATSLVGLVADELRRSCSDVSTVVERRDELIAMLPQLVADAGSSLAGMPVDAVVDAASALRCRELGAVGALRIPGA